MQERIKGMLRRHTPRFLRRWVGRVYYPRVLRNFPESKWPCSEVVRRLVGPGDQVVDVGANIGYVTVLLARWVGPQGLVHSFEPVADTCGWLSHNVKALRLGNVRTYGIGLSSEEREAWMGIPEYPSGGENLYESRVTDDPGGAGWSRRVKVRLRTLDSVLSGSTAGVSFIKIDAEGHELPILQGGRNLVSSSRPALLVEVSGTDAANKELLALLGSWGYGAYGWDGRRLSSQSPSRGGDWFFLQSGQLRRVGDLLG
jgi:FkbM family methyltransferase